MRFSIPFTGVLLIGLWPVAGSAQISGANNLANQIEEQQKAVETARGKTDGVAWLKLAILRQDAAQYSNSERAYRKAIALLNSGTSATLADALDQMGTMYVECGKFSKAEPLERRALAIREEGKDQLGIGISHMHLAVLLLGEKQTASAGAEAQMAVSLLVPVQGNAVQVTASPEEKMTALINLSLARCARQSCATAIPDLEHALEIAHANYVENSIPVGFLNFLLGYAHWKSGDNGSADGLMKKGTEELETQIGWGHPTYVQALRQYSMFLNQTGRTVEAKDIAAKVANLKRSPSFAQVASNPLSIGLE